MFRVPYAKANPRKLNMASPGTGSPPHLLGGAEYGMFEHFKRYPWVLETYRYPSSEHLIAGLAEHVIGPAEDYARSVATPRSPN
jgi:hypothetical protein